MNQLSYGWLIIRFFYTQIRWWTPVDPIKCCHTIRDVIFVVIDSLWINIHILFFKKKKILMYLFYYGSHEYYLMYETDNLVESLWYFCTDACPFFMKISRFSERVSWGNQTHVGNYFNNITIFINSTLYR